MLNINILTKVEFTREFLFFVGRAVFEFITDADSTFRLLPAIISQTASGDLTGCYPNCISVSPLLQFRDVLSPVFSVTCKGSGSSLLS
jgi:hypothetical protein